MQSADNDDDISTISKPLPFNDDDERVSPFIAYDQDHFNWPDLYTELDESMESCILIHPLSDLRRMARNGELANPDAILELPLTLIQVVEFIEENKEKLVDTKVWEHFYEDLLATFEERKMFWAQPEPVDSTPEATDPAPTASELQDSASAGDVVTEQGVEALVEIGVVEQEVNILAAGDPPVFEKEGAGRHNQSGRETEIMAVELPLSDQPAVSQEVVETTVLGHATDDQNGDVPTDLTPTSTSTTDDAVDVELVYGEQEKTGGKVVMEPIVIDSAMVGPVSCNAVAEEPPAETPMPISLVAEAAVTDYKEKLSTKTIKQGTHHTMTSEHVTPSLIIAFDDRFEHLELVYSVQVTHHRKRLTVCFRGSKTKLDWATDLEIYMKEVTNPLQKHSTQRPTIKVHNGFYNYLFEKSFRGPLGPNGEELSEYAEILQEHVVPTLKKYPSYKVRYKRGAGAT